MSNPIQLPSAPSLEITIPNVAQKRRIQDISQENPLDIKHLTLQMIRFVGELAGTQTINDSIMVFRSPEGEAHLLNLPGFQSLSENERGQILENRTLSANTLKNWERDERLAEVGGRALTKRIRSQSKRIENPILSYPRLRNQFIYKTITEKNLPRGKKSNLCKSLSAQFKQDPASLMEHFRGVDLETIKEDAKTLNPQRVAECFKTYQRQINVLNREKSDATSKKAQPQREPEIPLEMPPKIPPSVTPKIAHFIILEIAHSLKLNLWGTELLEVLRRPLIEIRDLHKFSGIPIALFERAKKELLTPCALNRYIRLNYPSTPSIEPTLKKLVHLEILRAIKKNGYSVSGAYLVRLLDENFSDPVKEHLFSGISAATLQAARENPLSAATIDTLILQEKALAGPTPARVRAQELISSLGLQVSHPMDIAGPVLPHIAPASSLDPQAIVPMDIENPAPLQVAPDSSLNPQVSAPIDLGDPILLQLVPDLFLDPSDSFVSAMDLAATELGLQPSNPPKNPRKEPAHLIPPKEALWTIVETLIGKGYLLRGKDFFAIFQLPIEETLVQPELSTIEIGLIKQAHKAKVSLNGINAYIRRHELLPPGKIEIAPAPARQAYLEIWNHIKNKGSSINNPTLCEILKHPLRHIKKQREFVGISEETLQIAINHPLEPKALRSVIKGEQARQRRELAEARALSKAEPASQEEPTISLPPPKPYILPPSDTPINFLAEASAFPMDTQDS